MWHSRLVVYDSYVGMWHFICCVHAFYCVEHPKPSPRPLQFHHQFEAKRLLRREFRILRERREAKHADLMEEAQVSKKPKCKKEMNHKTMKMKVGSAASKVRFNGWRNLPRIGISWLQNMCSSHQSTWTQAGIFDAITVSKYPIKRHDDLILELASRWCSKTNTFILPWGEATITLEDVIMLGGFSALGVTTLTPPENDAELLKIKEQLEMARKEVQSGKSRKATQGGWLKKFMGHKSEIEHEAFLMYWLSRFVFPVGSSYVINRHIFHMAIHLSRGVKFALARPVLGMLYKELAALNNRLTDMSFVSDTRNIATLDLFAPFHLVQLWAWERLTFLRPIENRMSSCVELPRAARWSKMKFNKDQDIRSAIDSSEDAFVWCPYDEFDKHSRKLTHECFGQCIKTRKLEGFDYVEKYLPQRVARQFGLVQDIPTDHGNELTNQVTSKDDELYMTSRLAKPTVTPRYLEWWKLQSDSSQVKAESGIDYGPPPGFPPQIQFITIDDSDDDDFSDDEDTLPGTCPSKNVLVSQIVPESPFSSSISGFSDTESVNGDKWEELEKANEQPGSISKTVQIKEEDCEQEERAPFEFIGQVITIDDSSEDEHKSEQPFPDPELPENIQSRDMVVGRGSDLMGKLTEMPMEDAGNSRGSNQDPRDVTEDKGKISSFSEVASMVPDDECVMNCDVEIFTNETTEGAELSLEGRISRLEKIVLAHIQSLGATDR